VPHDVTIPGDLEKRRGVRKLQATKEEPIGFEALWCVDRRAPRVSSAMVSERWIRSGVRRSNLRCSQRLWPDWAVGQ
jgi:hypothetical protein